MKINKPKVVDLILIGTGLAGLNFIDKYLEKKKIIHVISPNIKNYLDKKNKKVRALPSQMKGKDASGEIVCQYMDFEKVNEYFEWQPKHNLDNGLAKTIEWFTRYLESST